MTIDDELIDLIAHVSIDRIMIRPVIDQRWQVRIDQINQPCVVGIGETVEHALIIALKKRAVARKPKKRVLNKLDDIL